MTSRQEIIDILRDDTHYYGEYGRQFLSNTSIGRLLDDPQSFLKGIEETQAMRQGSYLHQLILEPQKASEWLVCDAGTRTTKAYNQFLANNNVRHAMLRHEIDELKATADTMLANITFHDIIRDDRNQYEVPAVGEIFGYQFKGKADILQSDGKVFDVKTTRDLDGFRFSAKKYGYNSQAFIYSELFGGPVTFLVVEKETRRLAIFDCSQEFIDSGRERVLKALDIYEKYFGPFATQDVDNYYITGTL